MSSSPRAFAFVPPALPATTLGIIRASVFVVALLPLAGLVQRGVAGTLGANPVEMVLRSLGTWTLVLLLATLAITPLRRVTGWAWLVRLRRMLGLFAFFYATLHVGAFVWLDHWFNWAEILADVVKRPYLNFGFAAYVLLIPLALTSTQAMVRRLGGRNWLRLHRSVYAIGVLGVLHFWFHKLAKNDLSQPVIYAVVLALLLGMRLAHTLSARTIAASSGALRQGRVDSPAKSSATVSRRRTQ